MNIHAASNHNTGGSVNVDVNSKPHELSSVKGASLRPRRPSHLRTMNFALASCRNLNFKHQRRSAKYKYEYKPKGI